MRIPPPTLTPEIRASGQSIEAVEVRRLRLVTLTPMVGGGASKQALGPEREPVRAASIRGQLRMWWRARHGGRYETGEDLYQAERRLWGGTGGGAAEVFPSQVRLSVEVVRESVREDRSELRPLDDVFYVLWPLGMGRGLSAPRWGAGLTFDLTVALPAEHAEEIRQALRDWILFGGVGGRTRRGAGALGVPDAEDRAWLGLPTGASDLKVSTGGAADDDGRDIGLDVAGKTAATHVLTLQGASALVGPSVGAGQAFNAWTTAFGWLRDFRQGAKSGPDTATLGDFARERPVWKNNGRGLGDRPGRSRWPEADMIRLSYSSPRGWAHPPRSDVGGERGTERAWPRASFGLPIQLQFQRKDRRNDYYPLPEPRGNQSNGNHLLGWAYGGKRRERLPSPLVVKPMQLADGRVAPIAVWFERTLPKESKVGLVKGDGLQWGTEAPFDRLRGSGDTDYYLPLKDKDTTREAFMDWLAKRLRTQAVTL